MRPRRYAHKACAEQKDVILTKEEKDKLDFEDYIIKVLKIDYITPKIRKQIEQYVKEYEFTYSGMLKALIYFYEIKGNSIDKSNGGIGIIPFIYNEAYNYYYTLWLANQRNEEKDIAQYVPKQIEVTIPKPKREKRRRRLFTFLD